MSILVHAEIHGIEGAAAELGDALAEHAAATARGAGSLGANVYVPLGADPGEYVLESWWRDERAMREHYASAGYGYFVERVGGLLAQPSDVRVHYVERSLHPVADLSADPTRQG